MKKLTSALILLTILVLVLSAGFFWGKRTEFFKSYEEENSELILDKVAKVFKLVALEANISELYDYKQYNYWDINILRKKALVRVKAKVSIGYDFEKVEFIIDDEKKQIQLKSFPKAEILSVDHELDYYDINEGLFNSFTGDDLTQINKKAKAHAIKMISNSDLFDQAEEQKTQILALLEEIFKSSGWTLRIESNEEILMN